ncbi:alpha/beta-hydrolase [Rickenella mellea]|uniref:Alpha/beta-hydrolase n=1 Tax=Rickenella mellea TaxID=50990 RepID=A0A4Y7PZW3_9AGAM|nr:alpha/beta-hydrolase [Rickenella mellea]
MDVIAGLGSTDIMQILPPSVQAFLPLLEKNRAQILSVKKNTFKYGDTDRHQLDIYYPATTPNHKPPILFFFYGGGFFHGDRSDPPPEDLSYACFGAFFASRGILTVIPDYRLVPNAVYPQPVEDVRDSMIYIVQNVTEGDPAKLFMLGHSAGAAHAASLLLAEPSMLQSTTLDRRIKGTALLSGALHFRGTPVIPPDILQQYYGTEEQRNKSEPFGLLGSASEETIASLPPVIMITAEKEPEGIVVANDDFAELLAKKTGTSVDRIEADGHNHISLTYALSSGQGEEWGEQVAKWVSAHAS